MGTVFQVVVRGWRGEKTTVDLCNTEEQMKNMTVKQLMEKVSQSFPYIKDSSASICLTFEDKVLDCESARLSDYGIQHMSVIDMMFHVVRSEEEEMRNTTMQQLKERIRKEFYFPAEHFCNLRLIFTDQKLTDDSALLSKCGIQHMSVICMTERLTGGGYLAPQRGDCGMGDKRGKNRSMEKLYFF